MSVFDRVKDLYRESDQLVNVETGKLIAYSTASSFLFIHIVLFTVFLVNKVTPMAVFNVFSILYYAYSFRLVQKEKFSAFVLIGYIEVVLHMSAATWTVGWGSGFQIVLIAINLMLFFSDYLGRFLNMHTLPSVPLSIFCAAMYLIDFVINRTTTPPYSLPYRVEFWLHIGWIITVFGISVMVLQSFVWLAFSNEKVLGNQATHDKLTGLGNRYYMMDYLSKLEKEHGFEGCWAALMDIDDFKRANDTYGHNYGDYILETIAVIMRQNRSVSTFARWGGEEFVFFGIVGEDKEHHIKRLEDLRAYIENYDFYHEGIATKITVTIGVANYEEGQTLEEWIDAIDRKLYEGKRSGKNKVVS